jgi:HSP20 family protein
VRVQLRGRLLEVTGRRDPPREMGDASYHRAEIMFGDFRRIVELPWEADESRVDARYRDGMLEIHLVAAPASELRDIPLEPRQSS